MTTKRIEMQSLCPVCRGSGVVCRIHWLNVFLALFFIPATMMRTSAVYDKYGTAYTLKTDALMVFGLWGFSLYLLYNIRKRLQCSSCKGTGHVVEVRIETTIADEQQLDRLNQQLDRLNDPQVKQ